MKRAALGGLVALAVVPAVVLANLGAARLQAQAERDGQRDEPREMMPTRGHDGVT